MGDLKKDDIPDEMIDYNAMYLGIRIKNLILAENVTREEADHICRQLLLGKAVEKYLNHEDYLLREMLNG